MTNAKSVTVKQLPERLNLRYVQGFLREISPLLEMERPRMVFDFSQVKQIDSSGVDMLLHCMEEAIKRNGDLKLAAVPPSSAVILELTRVDRLFEVFDTVSEAVDSFYGFSIAENGYKWYLAPDGTANGNNKEPGDAKFGWRPGL